MSGPPPPAGLRHAVERRSAPVLLWLSARPKLLLPGAVLALLIGGLAAPAPVGPALLLVLAGVLLWLSYLSWPVLDASARLLRCAMLALVVIAVLQGIT